MGLNEWTDYNVLTWKWQRRAMASLSDKASDFQWLYMPSAGQ